MSSPTEKPAASSAASQRKRPSRPAFSADSIGSTAVESTSQSRKSRIPVAVALRYALTWVARPCIRPIGRPRRMVEVMLADVLAEPAAKTNVHAYMLADTFTIGMFDLIDVRVGNPDHCPHGWPVDPEAEQAENRDLAPLSDLGPGDRATIVRLAEHDGALLHWFYDEGFVPGREIEVREAQPAAGQVTVRLNGDERAIGEKAAAGLFVRPA